MVCVCRGAFTICKFGDFDQVKGKLSQTGYHSLLQHPTNPSGTGLVAKGFVLI